MRTSDDNGGSTARGMRRVAGAVVWTERSGLSPMTTSMFSERSQGFKEEEGGCGGGDALQERGNEYRIQAIHAAG